MRGTVNAITIAEDLRRRIQRGAFPGGSRMGSVRAFSREFGCAPLTAHRALKLLAKDGLIVAEARYGYRLARSENVQRGQVVAVLEDVRNYEPVLGDIYEAQVSALRRGALSRGWVSISLPYEGQDIQSIGRQLKEMGATALILQDIGYRFPRGLVAALSNLGMPAVSLDAAGGAGVDEVMRDEMQGAGLAVEGLLKLGHRQMGWYGPLESSVDGRRRATGAMEVLMREKLWHETQAWRDIPYATHAEVARAYLQRPDRPKAVLALWQTAAQSLARAARELGLKLGEDLVIAGWALKEQIGNSYPADCPELLESGPTVTWSVADLCSLVLDRIDARRQKPQMPVTKLLLPMKLWQANQKESQ